MATTPTSLTYAERESLRAELAAFVGYSFLLGNDDVADVVRTAAYGFHAAYPQYEGHWDGPEWKVVRIRSRVVTKMGVAFEAGDVTIARREGVDWFTSQQPRWVAYSWRNAIDTAVGYEVEVVR